MNVEKNSEAVLVFGANSTIAKALISKYLASNRFVVAVTRDAASLFSACYTQKSKLKIIETTYSESSLNEVFMELSKLNSQFENIFICNGLLHNEALQPEKRIEDLCETSMAEVFMVNTVVPALILSRLIPHAKQAQACYLVVFSARVGSISDNKLGGWYSYRASKAALNSALKTFSIEYARRAKNIKLIAFHPGTVNSAMSKPFHATVPEGKLFEPDYVAGCLSEVMDETTVDGQLSYLDYSGKSIPW